MAQRPFTAALRHLLGGPAGDNDSDRDLLQRFAESRDEEAFALLVRRHGPLVLGVCRRLLDDEHDAEDAFQATFLVLARKASLRPWQASVGNWLFGVARRTALRARGRKRVREDHERQAAAARPSDGEGAATWQEVQPVLDEELQHLPAKYRMPLLLCYLQGKSREEAARELGWTPGMVKGCLERGRDQLRSRLTRRGVTFSAGALAACLEEGAVTAAPAVLMKTTVEAVGAGTVSAPVAALTQGVLMSMFWNKLKAAVLLTATVGVLGTGVFFGYRALADGRDAKPDTVAKPEKKFTPATNAETQEEALKHAKEDLEAIAACDRLVAEWLWPNKPFPKPVTLPGAAVNKVRDRLAVKESVPQAAEPYMHLSFYRGKELLRKVWVNKSGQWGVVRAAAPHWPLGADPRLVQTVEALAKENAPAK